MRKTLSSTALVFVAVALAFVLSSCYLTPWYPSSNFPAKWLFPILSEMPAQSPPSPITFTITSPCRLVDASGNEVEKIVASKSTPITWSNQNDSKVVIEFSSLDIVGKWAIGVGPGESRTTLVQSSLGAGHYRVRVKCMSGAIWIQGPTPPIEEEDDGKP
jgi:hypothetical protein